MLQRGKVTRHHGDNSVIAGRAPVWRGLENFGWSAKTFNIARVACINIQLEIWYIWHTINGEEKRKSYHVYHAALRHVSNPNPNLAMVHFTPINGYCKFWLIWLIAGEDHCIITNKQFIGFWQSYIYMVLLYSAHSAHNADSVVHPINGLFTTTCRHCLHCIIWSHVPQNHYCYHKLFLQLFLYLYT